MTDTDAQLVQLSIERAIRDLKSASIIIEAGGSYRVDPGELLKSGSELAKSAWQEYRRLQK